MRYNRHVVRLRRSQDVRERASLVAVSALGQLIEDIKATNDWSYDEMAARAGMSKSQFQSYAREPVRQAPKTPEMIYKIARGLGVPPWLVAEKVAESLSWPRPSRAVAPTLEETIEADPTLTRDDKMALLNFLRIRRGVASA